MGCPIPIFPIVFASETKTLRARITVMVRIKDAEFTRARIETYVTPFGIFEKISYQHFICILYDNFHKFLRAKFPRFREKCMGKTGMT